MDNHLNATSIKRQLQVVFAVSIVFVLISSIASYYSNQKLIESSKWVNHTNEVLREAENIISILKDAETGQRGYILTKDSAFLEPYFKAREHVKSSFANLNSLTIDNPVQQKYMNEVDQLIEQRLIQMENTLLTAVGSPSAGGTTLITVDYPEMLRGKKMMDRLRLLFNNVKKEENRLLNIRINDQATYITYTPILIVIASLVSIIVSILAYMRIKNDLEERIERQVQDEIKYEETKERIGVMESITRRLAAGEYSARSADQQKDELGKIAAALNEMAKALEKSFNELEQRNWLQTGNMQLSDAIRGERYVKNTAEKLIASLASYLNAQLGTVFLTDSKTSLQFAGGYAIQQIQDLPDGGGLMGQALKNRKTIIVRDVPEKYTRIASTAGSALPTHLIIIPLFHNNTPVGAMELGFFTEPKSAAIQFLDSNAEAMAIALNSAVNYEKMQNLLEETQAQAEELQAQQNELEGLNTELETQTEKLQASEEELKVQQEELMEANTELEEKARLLEERNFEVSEKNKQVIQKAEELALSAKYKSEFLANMSHELRTPLNSILLLSRLLKENNEQNLTGDQIEYAKVIQSSGNGLLALIDEILDLSKIEAGKMSMERHPVHINELTDDMHSLFDVVAKEKGIELRIEVSDNAPTVIESDKLRLEQILRNLLSNALKFTSAGYVALKIYEHARTKGWISFEVKDTGIGIAKNKQQLIFEAFQQADGSTRRKFGGTGLGLSISRELGKLLGGAIELQSKEGNGSSFILHMPVSAEFAGNEPSDQLTGTAAAKPTAMPEKYRALTPTLIPENIPDDREQIKMGDKCILIVEDDINFARSLLEFTRKQGYKGIVAVRGDEGVQLAHQFMPSGILLDIELPVKNGWQVMDELKNDPTVRHIPVHIMSSHSVRKESLMKGAVDFIDKPMAAEQMQEIFSKLEHIINRTTKKVLIVEDNPKHAHALAYFLGSFNITSELKNTVPDSIEALKEGADCVILDMGIPDQKGYDILESVKKTPNLENLPIIIFTGKSLSMAEEQRIKKYADSIIVKTVHSYQRMLDEVSIFLHLVAEKGTAKKGDDHKKLGALHDVLGGKTVLIVDDDVRNIYSLSKALEHLKVNVVTAMDGKEALARLEEIKTIDVVLLDMMMPEMDGYETATRIRQRKEWKNLPVIAVTAKAMMGDRDKCIKAGASDYVTKPVDIDQLLSLLRVWLYEKI